MTEAGHDDLDLPSAKAWVTGPEPANRRCILGRPLDDVSHRSYPCKRPRPFELGYHTWARDESVPQPREVSKEILPFDLNCEADDRRGIEEQDRLILRDRRLPLRAF